MFGCAMIPGMLAQRFVSNLATAFSAYASKQIGEASASFAVNELPKLEDPVLLVALPTAIVKENFVQVDTPKFDCPNRAELDDHCSNMGFFDRLTVPPVNNELHRRGISLTKDSLMALKNDMDHTKQMSFSDPVHKKIEDYRKAPELQKDIASSFAKAGEREGALMHNMIAKTFSLRSTAYEFVIAPLEVSIRGPGQSIE